MVTIDTLRDRIDLVIRDMEAQFAGVVPTLEDLADEILGGSKPAYAQFQSLGRTLLAPMIDHYGLMAGSLAAEWYDLNRDLLQVGGNWSGATIQDPNVDTGPMVGGVVKDFVTAESIMSGLMSGMDRRIRQTANGSIMDSVLRDRQATGWARVASVGCCAYCALLASRGAVYRTQFTATFSPHENCVPGWTTVAATSVEYATRRWYAGEMFTIHTERGQKLSITPNHSVLTDKGWVPAGFLREGDGVFGGLDRDRVVLRVPNEEHRISSIEDYWRALRMVGRFSRVPLAAEDFHGDAPDGEVEIVGIDRHLAPERYPGLGKPLSEQALTLGSPDLAGAFAGLCNRHARLVGSTGAAYGRVSRSGELLSLGGAEFGHSLAHRLALGSGRLARFDEYATHGATGTLEVLREAFNTHAAAMHGDQFADLSAGGNPSGEPVGVRFDAPATEFAADGLRVHAKIGRDLIDRLSGLVSGDRIVSVERGEFRGHVYNLSTDEGWYSADGLIVSNCHCQAMPLWSADPNGTSMRTRADTIATRTIGDDEAGRKQRARQNAQARLWIEQNRSTLGLLP